MASPLIPPAPKPSTREIGTITNTPPPPASIVGAGRLGMGWGSFIQEGEHVPELRWPQSIRWYEEMLFADSMINQMYMSLVMPLSEYVWAINPNEANKDLTQALADDLGLPVGLPTQDEEDEYQIQPGMFTFNFLAHVEESLLAVPFGHYYFEKVGVIADGLWRLTKLAPRHPATIMQMFVEANGDLTSIRQYHSPDGFTSPPEPIPYSSLVPYVWRGDARAKWIGRPMLRPIYRSWLIRDILIRVDAINHERAGGVPGVETDQTFEGTSLADLQALATNFRVGEDSGYALPPGAKLVLNKLGGTDVVRSLEYHDNQIAGQWRSMVEQLGQTATGNRALGQTFAGLQDIAQRAIARWFSAIFREQVIRYWWDVNVPRLPDGSLPPHPLLAWRVPKGSATDPIAPAAPPLMQREPALGSGQTTAPAGGGSGGDVAARRPDPTPPTVPGGARSGASSPRAVGLGAVGARGPLIGGDPSGRQDAQVFSAEADSPPHSLAPARASVGTGETVRGTDAPAVLNRFPPNLRRDPTPIEIAAKTDFAGLQATHDDAEAQAQALLHDEWIPQLTQQLHDAILALGDDPTPDRLAAIHLVPPDAGPLQDALLALATRSADAAGAELAAQSITVPVAPTPEVEALIRGQAEAVATQVANGIALAGTRKAAQLTNPAAPTQAADIASGVRAYLAGLAHQWETDQMTGAASQAVNAGRFATFGLVTAPATFYASELLDNATCAACAGIDGTAYPTLADATQDYPGGGFVDCAGGPRCRGTVVAVSGAEV